MDSELHLKLDCMPSFTATSISNSSSSRRFNAEQVQYLERMYEAEARPELHIKQQLANKLGLMPRQVAIWFQNKRARSKSTRIQYEYNMLQASYDHLTSKFESLKHKNDSQRIQVQALRQVTDGGSELDRSQEDIKLATDDNMPKFPLETRSRIICKSGSLDYPNGKDDHTGEARYALHEPQLIYGCLTSAEEEGLSLHADDLLQDPNWNSKWWEW